MIRALRIELFLFLFPAFVWGIESPLFSGHASLGMEGISSDYAGDYLSWKKGIGYHRGLFATADASASLLFGFGNDSLFSVAYSFNAAQGIAGSRYFKMNHYLDMDYNLSVSEKTTVDISLTAHDLFHHITPPEQVFADLLLSGNILYAWREETIFSFLVRGGYMAGLQHETNYLNGPVILTEFGIIHEKTGVLRRIKASILWESTLARDVRENRPNNTSLFFSGKKMRWGTSLEGEFGIKQFFFSVGGQYDFLHWLADDTDEAKKQRRMEHQLVFSGELGWQVNEQWKVRLFYLLKKVFSTEPFPVQGLPDYRILLHTGGLELSFFSR